MQPRRVTIVSSPPPSTKTLPGIGVASPGSRGTGPVYRIEERSRTIYVSSDVDPKDWDTHSLNTILSLADQPDGDQLSAEPVRRSRSHVEREIIITPEPDVPLSPHDAPTSSRTSILFSRKPVVKSSSAPNSTPSSPTRRSPQRAGRPQILFYNKEDPYYGFTNFSAHPVIYKGKRYPTSEHLFQSFKVCIFFRYSKIMTDLACSFTTTGPTWLSIFGHALNDLVLLSLRLDASSQRSDPIGSK